MYYTLTKPGIIFGNMLTALGGFFLLKTPSFSLTLFLGMALGLACIIGAGCVANNYQDRFLDANMKRTQTRALVNGQISPRHAFIFSSALLTLGSLFLAFLTNWQALSAALIGFCIYVFVYTPLKPKSSHATLIGSISGAMPPAVGYLAVHNSIDLAALFLFLMTTLWQMPHFFAISLYRIEDYKEAGVPVLPIKQGIHKTKIQMCIYLIAFSVIPPLLFLCNFVNLPFLLLTSFCNVLWLILSFKGFFSAENIKWAKQMFLFSLITITLINTTLIGNYFL
jgi:protoheme IX farnesyltransferase